MWDSDSDSNIFSDIMSSIKDMIMWEPRSGDPDD